MIAMTTRFKQAVLTAALLTGATACGSSAPPVEEKKPAPAANATSVTFTADQIGHGGVRWEAATTANVGSHTELPGRLVLTMTAPHGWCPAQGRM